MYREEAGVSFFVLFRFFVFLGPHLQHMEVPRLGVKSELWLPAYTTATATWDLSCICDHSPRQHQIPDPLCEARDLTCILMHTSQLLLSHNWNFLLLGDS